MLPTLPQRRSATALRRAAQGESTRTIIIALVANIVIAIAKLIGGLVSGSTGMLAEAAHSAADSANEIFLAVGLHRASRRHTSLGHGRERFLWAFMAAIASFLIGGCLSIALAVAELKARQQEKTEKRGESAQEVACNEPRAGFPVCNLRNMQSRRT
jgi:divalent metal cation (Fe/Co/Zn/Cd) transporter